MCRHMKKVLYYEGKSSNEILYYYERRASQCANADLCALRARPELCDMIKKNEVSEGCIYVCA